MKALGQVIYRVYRDLALVSFSLLALIVGWQVFARYILNNSPSWSEPLAMLLLLYAVMLGTAVGVRNGSHLSLVWFRLQFSDQTQHWLSRLESLLIGGFGIAMAVYGGKMAAQTWAYLIPGLPVPMGMQYLALVAGGAAIALFALETLIDSKTLIDSESQ